MRPHDAADAPPANALEAGSTLVAEQSREAALGLLVDVLAERVAEHLRPLLESESAAGDPWRLLNVEEAAERLGRSTRWVRERAHRGDLPFVKLDGGALAFELDDLRAFAEARRVGDQPLAGRLQAVPDAASANGSRSADRVGNRRVAA